mmetsp:Transcript_28841/g.95908  ORF Transcript_28841/g.95908 Transcript_28841/m.95908 type:complete len:223 (-) Transcript_28841:584-1252(-)
MVSGHAYAGRPLHERRLHDAASGRQVREIWVDRQRALQVLAASHRGCGGRHPERVRKARQGSRFLMVGLGELGHQADVEGLLCEARRREGGTHRPQQPGRDARQVLRCTEHLREDQQGLNQFGLGRNRLVAQHWLARCIGLCGRRRRPHGRFHRRNSGAAPDVLGPTQGWVGRCSAGVARHHRHHGLAGGTAGRRLEGLVLGKGCRDVCEEGREDGQRRLDG